MIELSIVIPVYNVEKYIKGTLDSIIAQMQDCFEYEVIIVDDGSPDNSIDIVNSYSDKICNLVIIRQENEGLSEARNTGLLASRGRYVWFVDSDDTLPSDAFQIVEKSLEVPSQIYCFDVNKIKECTGEIKSELIIPQRRYHYLYNYSNSGRYLYRKIQYGMVQRFIFERSFLLDYGLKFYKGMYFEDLDFLLRAQFLSKAIIPINKKIYNYLIRERGSIMSCITQKHLIDRILLVRNLCNFRDCFAKTFIDRSIFDDAAFNQLYWIYSRYKNVEGGKAIMKEKVPQIKMRILKCGLLSLNYISVGKVCKLLKVLLFEW